MGFVGSLFGSSNNGVGTGMNYTAVAPSAGQLANANALTQGTIANAQGINPLLFATATGQGPNVAGTMLANQAGQIAQQQAGMQASQRGASANPALIARQAGYAGANARAQAAGQAAQLGQEQMLTGQSNYANYLQGQEGAAIQNQNSLYNLQENANSANAGLQSVTAKEQPGLLGGAVAGLGTLLANGGAVHPLALGGGTAPVVQNKFENAQGDNGAKSSVSQFQSGAGTQNGGGFQMGQGFGLLAAKGAKGLFGSKPAAPQNALGGNFNWGNFGYGDPGADVGDALPAAADTGTAMADLAPLAMGAKGGKVFAGRVPGRAKKKGDSYANDTVPMRLSSGGMDMLSPGEIVLPRHVTQAKDAPEKAKKFVEALLRKGGYRGRI